jgi:hypothetical protein
MNLLKVLALVFSLFSQSPERIEYINFDVLARLSSEVFESDYTHSTSIVHSFKRWQAPVFRKSKHIGFLESDFSCCYFVRYFTPQLHIEFFVPHLASIADLLPRHEFT